MAVTTTSNVIIPEVLAAMIAAEIPGQLALAGSDAVTVLDNLKGGPGNTIKIPRWGTIGDFTEVAEGNAMPVVNIAATAATATGAPFAGLDLLSSSVLVLDAGLKIRYINSAAENLLAVSSRSAVGALLGEIVEASASLHEALEEVLATLTDSEREIIRMRFGLGDYQPMSLQQIGEKFNLSKERIRQIEKKAIRRLRHPSRSHKLKSFL